MAATLVTTIKRFIGTAAEMAALSVVGVPSGSTYFQDDTGLLYVLNSAGNWNPKKITGDVQLMAGNNFVGTVSIAPDSDGNVIQVNSNGSINTQLTGRNVVLTTTILSGQSISDEIDLQGFQLFAIRVPSTWDAANITFAAARTSTANGGTYVPVYDDAGGEVTVTVTADKMIVMSNLALAIAPLQYIKIRSGSVATPVQQTADRTLYLIGKV